MNCRAAARRQRVFSRHAVALAVLSALAATTVGAQSLVWVGGSDGQWEVDAHWGISRASVRNGDAVSRPLVGSGWQVLSGGQLSFAALSSIGRWPMADAPRDRAGFAMQPAPSGPATRAAHTTGPAGWLPLRLPEPRTASVTNRWIGSDYGSWSDAANWTLGVPQPDHDVDLGLWGGDDDISKIRPGDSFSVRSFNGYHSLGMSRGQLNFSAESSISSLSMSNSLLAGSSSLRVDYMQMHGGSSVAITGHFDLQDLWVQNGSLSALGGTTVNGAFKIHLHPSNGDADFTALLIEGNLEAKGSTRFGYNEFGGAERPILRLAPGTGFHNLGTFYDESAQQGTILGGAGSSVLNSNRFVKNVGGSTFIGVSFENEANARLEIHAGELALGGSSVLRGTLDVHNGAALQLAQGGGLHRLIDLDGSTSTGGLVIAGAVTADGINRFAGTVQFSAGSLSIATAGSFTAAQLDMQGGELVGGGTFLVSGPANWTAGRMSSATSGRTLLNGDVTLSGNGRRQIVGREVVLNGISTWTNTSSDSSGVGGFEIIGQGSILHSAGSFLDQTSHDTAIVGTVFGIDGRGRFLNSGSYTKTGLSTVTVSAEFINTGDAQLEVFQGTLILGRGAVLSGTVNIGADAELQFRGPSSSSLVNMIGSTSLGRMSIGSGAYVNSSGSGSFGGTLVLDDGGSLSIGSDFTAGGLNLRGGTVGGGLSGGAFTVSGTVDWTGGSFSNSYGGSGIARLLGPINIGGAQSKYLTGPVTVELLGATTWTGGYIFLQYGPQFINLGSFDDHTSGDNFLISYLGGDGNFVNHGSFTKSGSARTLVDLGFNNMAGADLVVDAGTLVLHGGGSNLGGRLKVATDATLELGSGPVHVFDNLAGAGSKGRVALVDAEVNAIGDSEIGGTLAMRGQSTLRLTGNLTLNDFQFNGGVVAGTGTLVVKGPFTWNDLRFSSDGLTRFEGGVLVDGAEALFGYRTTELAGTNSTRWTGAVIQVDGHGKIVNRGVFFDQTSGGELRPSPSVSVIGNFINHGQYRKSGHGLTSVSLGFSNLHGAALEVEAGTLALLARSNLAGAVNVAADARLQFGGGAAHLLDGVTFGPGTGALALVDAAVTANGSNTFGGTLIMQGASRLRVDGSFSTVGFDMQGGELAGSGNFIATGEARWTAGSLLGTGRTQFLGKLRIESSGQKQMGEGRIEVADTTWSGGDLLFVGPGQIVNTGLFRHQATAGQMVQYQDLNDFSRASWFHNEGHYQKLGAGLTSLANNFSNAASATLQVDEGALLLAADTHLGGRVLVAEGARLELGWTNQHTLRDLDGSASRGELLVTARTHFAKAEGQSEWGGLLALRRSLSPVTGFELPGGKLSVDGQLTTARLELRASGIYNVLGSEITGSGTLTVKDSAVWTGAFTGGGTTLFEGPVGLGGETALLVSRTIVFTDTATWWGPVYVAGGGRLENRGAFIDGLGGQGLGLIALTPRAEWLTGGGSFENHGLYRKTGGWSEIGLSFSNLAGATLAVEAGELVLSGGSALGGTVQVAAGASLRLTGAAPHMVNGIDASASTGQLVLAGNVSFNGATMFGGTVALVSGNYVLNGSFEAAQIQPGAGSFSGTGQLSLSNPVEWTGGSVQGAANMRFAGPVSITGGGNVVQGRNVTLAGDSQWSGGTIVIGGGGSITNQGSFADLGLEDHDIAQAFVPGSASFVNAGTYTKSGDGLTTVKTRFVNAPGATLDLQGGSIYLERGSELSGTVTVAQGAALKLGNLGNHVWQDLDASQGGGRVELLGASVRATGINRLGTLNITGQTNLNANGSLMVNRLEMHSNDATMTGPAQVDLTTLDWRGGRFLNGGTITVDGLATISQGNNVVQGSGLVLKGETRWTGGAIIVGGNGSITNQGSFKDLNAEDNSIAQAFVAGSRDFINAGTYTKSGAGQTLVSAKFINQAGATLAIEAGNFFLERGSELSGVVTVAQGSALRLGGSHSWLDLTASQGGGRVELLGASVTATGANRIGTLSMSGASSLDARGPLTLNRLELHSDEASLRGSAFIGVTALDWRGGKFLDAGTTHVVGSATISAGTNIVQGRALAFNGPTEWTGGTILIGGDGLMANTRGFYDQTVGEALIGITFTPGRASFLNVGAYAKTNLGTTTVLPRFESRSVLAVQQGLLVLAGGSKLEGYLSVGLDGVLRLTGGGHTLSKLSLFEPATGGQRVELLGATVTATGSNQLGDVTIAGATSLDASGEFYMNRLDLRSDDATLRGTASIRVNTFDWRGGAFLDAGTATVSGDAAISAGNNRVQGRQLVLQGVTRWTGGTLLIGGDGNITNNGSFQDRTSGEGLIATLFVPGSATFVNAGHFVKTNAGSTTVLPTFVNAANGQVRVEAGTLTLNGLAHQPVAAAGSPPTLRRAAGRAATADATVVPGLAGGSFTVLAGAALVYGGPGVVTNTASITLDGPGSEVRLLGGANALAGLSGNAAGASLNLRGGRELAVAGDFANAGLVQLSTGARLATTGRFANAAAGLVTLDGGAWAGSALDNAGRVAGFGELAGVVSGAGELVVAGGTLSLHQGGQVGRLQRTDGRLALGGDLRISGDYDNTGFGVGTAFNPRAGIDGPGRILAASPVVMQLTGEHVTGGTRLVLPSFRVGQGGVDSSFAVRHGGGDGPALRATVRALGSVDATLSGSALEGLSSGPVVAGQSSAALTLRFNPAVGQVLDGQALQVVSNFDNVAPLSLAITGRAYSPALAELASTRIDFGIVRVGDVVPVAALAIANRAPGTLTDELWASLGTTTGPFRAQGQTAAIMAGMSDASSLTVALDTHTNGVFAAAAPLALTSRNPDLPDLDLGSLGIQLQARIHATAFASLVLAGGPAQFSGGGASYTLDLGTLTLGQDAPTVQLMLRNGAAGTSDDLAGAFDLAALPAQGWLLDGFEGFSGLANGAASRRLQIRLQPQAEGQLSATIHLATRSTNGVGPDLALSGLDLHLSAQVVAVPEPGTWALWLAGLAITGARLRRRSSSAAQAAAAAAR